MPTPSLIIPSAPVYDEGNLYGLNVYGTQFAPEAIPFTRATTATRTNAAGLIELVPYNLLTWSEQFDNAAWGKLGGSSVIANQAIAPNGTMTADLITEGTSVLVYNTIIYPAGTYTQSYYAKKGTGDIFGMYFGGGYGARFNLTTGTVVSVANATASIINIGDGWYRCIATATPTADFYAGISYVNSTGLTVYAWGAQLVEGTSALPYLKTETRLNRPRVDFSLGGCPNLLLEPQRTNLALQSSSFDNASWGKLFSSVTANSTTSPSGVVDADTFTADGAFGLHALTQIGNSINGTTYTHSIYAKKNTNDFIQLFGTGSIYTNLTTFANFDLNLGVVGTVGAGTTASIQNVGNGWYRCTMTATATATTSGNFISPCLVTSATSPRAENNSLSTSVFLWGAQLEAGAYETSYIPTTTTSVTRNADSFTDSNIFSRGMITAAGGTWFVEFRNNFSLLADDAVRNLWLGPNQLGPSTNGTLHFRQGGGITRTQIWKFTSGVATSLYQTLTNTSKIAIKWNGSTADVFENGVKVVSATAFPHNNMEFISALGGRILNINSMALYPTPLSDSELISMTTL